MPERRPIFSVELRTAATLFSLFLWIGCAALAADAPQGLLYVAHFDEYAGANWAVGSRTPPAPVGQPRLVPGKSGKAIRLSQGQGFRIVGNDGNLNPAEGSVQMWVRPSWHGADGQVHRLFSAYVERGNYLTVNKLADNQLGVATGGAGVGSYKRVNKDISAWKAGEWHHIAFSWGDGKLALFIDGEKIGEVNEAIPPKRAMPEIHIGPSLDGALDELAIWGVRKESFDLSAPISVPDMGPITPPPSGPPPVG